MKTLDELIANMEAYPIAGNISLISSVSVVLRDDIDDCISYLKQYRESLSNENQKNKPEENKPLTWEELKQLKGEPVWIEELNVDRGYWAIVSSIRNSYFGPVVDLATGTGWRGFNIYDNFTAYRGEPK